MLNNMQIVLAVGQISGSFNSSGETIPQNTMTNTNTTKRITKFNSLSEAVKHADLDLSYNQFIADQEIKSLEEDGVTEVYVTEDNEVYYIYQCDIRILNKFSPFSHCVSNSPFQHVYTIGNELTFTDTFIQKNAQNRKTIALHDILVH